MHHVKFQQQLTENRKNLTENRKKIGPDTENAAGKNKNGLKYGILTIDEESFFHYNLFHENATMLGA